MARMKREVKTTFNRLISGPIGVALQPMIIFRPEETTAQRLQRVLVNMWRNSVNLVLPPQCVSCRTRLADLGFCASCWCELGFIEAPLCDRLGIPFDYNPGDGIVSAAALAYPPAYARARAVVRYDDVARALVHRFKYKDALDAAPLLGAMMKRSGRHLFADSDIVIPVPLYRSRLWWRRYNQAAILANEIAAQTGLGYEPQLLERTRKTKSQVGLSARQRRRNVSGAFAINESAFERISGKRVLLIDDVITTGATIESCSKALLNGGAEVVNVLAFARVVDPLNLPI